MTVASVLEIRYSTFSVGFSKALFKNLIIPKGVQIRTKENEYHNTRRTLCNFFFKGIGKLLNLKKEAVFNSLLHTFSFRKKDKPFSHKDTSVETSSLLNLVI